jgi:hypothetical protein
MNFFDKWFDYNKDGKLSFFENTVKWTTLEKMWKANQKKEAVPKPPVNHEEKVPSNRGRTKKQELEAAGINSTRFAEMDDYEKVEALENACLNPEKFGFDMDEDSDRKRLLWHKGIDPNDFDDLEPHEQVQLLESVGLDPVEFDLSQESFEVASLIDAGIDPGEFYDGWYSDEEKEEMVLAAGLDPIDFNIL